MQRAGAERRAMLRLEQPVWDAFLSVHHGTNHVPPHLSSSYARYVAKQGPYSSLGASVFSIDSREFQLGISTKSFVVRGSPPLCSAIIGKPYLLTALHGEEGLREVDIMAMLAVEGSQLRRRGCEHGYQSSFCGLALWLKRLEGLQKIPNKEAN